MESPRGTPRAGRALTAALVLTMCLVVTAGMTTGTHRRTDGGVVATEGIVIQFAAGLVFIVVAMLELRWLWRNQRVWWSTPYALLITTVTLGLFCFWAYARLQAYGS